MFIGRHYHTLDAKGRLIIPSKFRKSESFVVSYWIEDCLWAYPLEEWKKIDEKLIAERTVENWEFIRRLYAKATECSLDTQGRIIIPQELREDAKLTKDIIIIGISTMIEIWDKQRWEEYERSKKHSTEDIMNKIGKLRV